MKATDFLFAALLGSAVVAAPAQAEVQAASAHGFVISNEASTRLPVDRVWRALTQDVDLWWPKDHSWWRGTFSIDARAGGCFCEVKHNKSAQHMQVVLVEPGKKLIMTGGLGPLQAMGVNGALTWQLTKQGSGTTVTVSYRVHGFNPDGFEQLAPVVDTVQAAQLSRLVAYVNQAN